jgi:DNA-binding NarL/FixJ family response regulator
VTLRVLIADDHPAFRQGLAAMLDATDDIEVVGLASSGAEAVAMSNDLVPDVVAMDVRMPDGNGIDATRRLLAANPSVGVAVVTMFEDDDSVFAAMRAGARGYLLKDAGRDEILGAIRAIGAGQAIFSPGIARRLIAYFAATPEAGVQAFPELTPREREVLELIARGMGNAPIAHQLDLSLKTVRNHVSNIFNKLQVADRAAAIVKAREAGLGRPTA